MNPFENCCGDESICIGVGISFGFGNHEAEMKQIKPAATSVYNERLNMTRNGGSYCSIKRVSHRETFGVGQKTHQACLARSVLLLQLCWLDEFPGGSKCSVMRISLKQNSKYDGSEGS